MTVEWSRPPNLDPMTGKDVGVYCRQRYMASCLGRAIFLVLLFDFSSPILILKCSQIIFWIFSMVTSLCNPSSVLRSTSLARSVVISVFVRDAKAPNRVRAPSSSLTLEFILVAMKTATSWGSITSSASAFFRRIAILVSTSGGWISAIRPHSKRFLRRLSNSGISLGNLSDVMMICL